MLLSNARIVKNESVHFYEKDILMDDHVYNGDIQVTIKVDYVTPGIGIALVSDEGLSLSEEGETYLFRVGHSDYSLIRKQGLTSEVLVSGSIVNVKPYKSNLEIQLKLIDNRASFYVNNKLIFKKYLPSDMNSYMVGYYSNAGNTINSISVASEIPDGWIVNMSNTNGGYIKFATNKFTISNCSDKAEIEQPKIRLSANTESSPYYYLKYDKDDLNGMNDILSYISLTKDDRYSDKTKNLLDSSGKFSIKTDSEINLKFVGTNGTIKNIQLTDGVNDFYVPTSYDQLDINGSCIKVKTDDISRIDFSGIIYSVPNDQERSEYGFVRDMDWLYAPHDYDINIGQDCLYDYSIVIEAGIKKSYMFITKDGMPVNTLTLTIKDSINIFENMDALINKLALYKKDGEIIDVINQDTKIQYVPASIKSPIVVTDETGTPLNLSTSYRIIDTAGTQKYEFTNIEREIFKPENKIRLTNKPSDKIDTITVYGVLKDSSVHPECIYAASGENIRSINDYCDLYEILQEDDIYKIDKDSGLLVLTNESDYTIASKYQQIVVDYLKSNSYAVNYRHELGSYELDISASDNTMIYYDGIMSNRNKELVNVNEYKIISTLFENDKYIVLKGR